MKESTGNEPVTSKHGKSTILAEGKVGKTVWIAASCLGVLPNQRESGGVVSRPQNLHIIGIDSAALEAIKPFLTKKLGAPEEALNYSAYNMEEDVYNMGVATEDYDLGFYNAMQMTYQRIAAKIAASPNGVHAIVISSLTGMANALERAVAGPPGSAGSKNANGEKNGKGYMDPSKWKILSHQMNQLRYTFQRDIAHCIWEGHIDVSKSFSMGKDGGGEKEKVAISGEAGRNWAYNTDHVFRLRRNFGDCWEGTEVDKIHLDTRPSMEFIASGRGFTEFLKKEEYNLTKTYEKLGKRVGNYKPFEGKKTALKKSKA